MIDDNLLLDTQWRDHLSAVLGSREAVALRARLNERSAHGAKIYPAKDQIFAAFNETPFDQVKVVILGQDPYHGPGQAMGLSFSVNAKTKTPPSLRNIFKEVQRDIGNIAVPDNDLTPWAQQGVLLLNSILTVEEGVAAAHRRFGWQVITDRAIAALSDHRKDIVFLLWGAFAQEKARLVDENRHCILTAPHPSPLSAHRGFIGCDHFSKANAYLTQTGQIPVTW